MSDEIRAQVRRLLNELGITQTQVIKKLNQTQKYHVNPSEFSAAMNGLNTPKTRRVLNDALSILVKEKIREETLIDLAKNC